MLWTVLTYFTLFVLGTFERLFKYIWQIEDEPKKVLNKKILQPGKKEYFIFHILASWISITFILPYLLRTGKYFWFSVVDLFIWVNSIIVFLLGLDQISEVYGSKIGTFSLVRNIIEFIVHLFVIFYYQTHHAFHFLLYGLWWHRIIDTFPRFALREYPTLNFIVELITYALTIFVGWTGFFD